MWVTSPSKLQSGSLLESIMHSDPQVTEAMEILNDEGNTPEIQEFILRTYGAAVLEAALYG